MLNCSIILMTASIDESTPIQASVLITLTSCIIIKSIHYNQLDSINAQNFKQIQTNPVEISLFGSVSSTLKLPLNGNRLDWNVLTTSYEWAKWQLTAQRVWANVQKSGLRFFYFSISFFFVFFFFFLFFFCVLRFVLASTFGFVLFWRRRFSFVSLADADAATFQTFLNAIETFKLAK